MPGSVIGTQQVGIYHRRGDIYGLYDIGGAVDVRSSYYLDAAGTCDV